MRLYAHSPCEPEAERKEQAVNAVRVYQQRGHGDRIYFTDGIDWPLVGGHN